MGEIPGYPPSMKPWLVMIIMGGASPSCRVAMGWLLHLEMMERGSNIRYSPRCVVVIIMWLLLRAITVVFC